METQAGKHISGLFLCEPAIHQPKLQVEQYTQPTAKNLPFT